MNPCGKLSITFPRHIEDTSHENYPGDNDIVHYGEGIYVGYRFYDHMRMASLFPFGAGLLYTCFSYSNIRLSYKVNACDGRRRETVEVQVDVTNTTGRDGKEIVQFYVAQVSKLRLNRPVEELKG